MITKINLSQKLEKSVPKEYFICNETEIINPLEKWNATIFYVSRKKCLLIINSITKYFLILENFKTSDLKNFNNIFIDTFHNQLKYDGINFDKEKLKNIIEKTQFYSTDGDRPIIGLLNITIQDIDAWKFQYDKFEDWDFRDINNKLNKIPICDIGY